MTEHFAYPVPFNKELEEDGLIPYRTNEKLHRKIDYLFRHVSFMHRELFIEVSTSGSRQLVSDMSTKAVAIARYFIKNPQQFGNKMDNIHMQIIIRMWKQLFRHCLMQERELDKYYAMKMRILGIENGLLEELIRTVDEEDFVQNADDMIKKRTGSNLRDSNRASMKEGSKHFEYLCNLE